ncbi:hypothetical protein RFI_33700, partial [Reticulomyxa filosa]
ETKCMEKKFEEAKSILEDVIEQSKTQRKGFQCRFIMDNVTTLKHIEVEDRGIPGWLTSTKFAKEKWNQGQNMIVVSLQNEELKQKGIREGFRIVRINGHDVSNHPFAQIQKEIIAAVNDTRQRYQIVFEEGILSWFDLDVDMNGSGTGPVFFSSSASASVSSAPSAMASSSESVTIAHHGQATLAPHSDGVHVTAWLSTHPHGCLLTQIQNKNVAHESFEEIVALYYQTSCPFHLTLLRPSPNHTQHTVEKLDVVTSNEHQRTDSADTTGVPSLSEGDSDDESVSSDSDNNNKDAEPSFVRAAQKKNKQEL